MAKSGRVALVGRPNAGKSTLMNRWLGEKVSIVSDKPQTTRHRMVGILSEERGQIVFFDTPGMHKPLYRLNRQMVQAAMDALADADVVCVLVDAAAPSGHGDAYLLDLVNRVEKPKVLLLNKIDRIEKSRLLPLMERYAREGSFVEIVPISAKSGDGAQLALDLLWQRLGEGAPAYDPELLTIHPERFLVAERIREKVLAATADELPFTTAVVIERWEEVAEKGLLRLHASLLVEREGQKKILIGKGGQKIKEIGTAARLDLEEHLGQRVYLDLNVRVEPNWRENPRILAQLDRDVDLGLDD